MPVTPNSNSNSNSLASWVSRRDAVKGVLTSAGLVGTALLTDRASQAAQAMAQASPQAGGAALQSAEYWANKGSVRLNLWRKRLARPAEAGFGAGPLPVLFLVHGSSNSARSSYDLSVPGRGEYSTMNVMARAGYDVWTMDHDGYSLSGSSGNNSDIDSGVDDLRAAIPLVLRETGQTKMHFYGTSSGAIRAGAYAQVAPERVDRLIMSAHTHKVLVHLRLGDGSNESPNFVLTRGGGAMPK